MFELSFFGFVIIIALWFVFKNRVIKSVNHAFDTVDEVLVTTSSAARAARKRVDSWAESFEISDDEQTK